MDPYFFTIAHRVPAVIASLVIAVLSSYVAVEFAGRVRAATDPATRWVWNIAGSVTMGSGMWAMHFVGMSAAVYPFAAAFEPGLTAASWFVAVAASMFAFFVCGLPTMTNLRIGSSAFIVGAAMASMHFVGMRGMVMTPGTVYHAPWVAGAFGLAWAGAAAAMAMFRHLATTAGSARLAWQTAIAFVLGVSYAGMHYLAMASTDFADDAVCMSVNGLNADQLGSSVGAAAMTMLILMLLMIGLQKRAEKRAADSDRSLGRAHEELRDISLRDTVTRLPNRLVFQDRLKQAADRCDRAGTELAVMFVDLDAFNAHDRRWLGMDGETLLRGVAERLTASARATDTVACLGGDQFLLMIDSLTDVEPVVRVAEQIARSLSEPFELATGPCRLTASVGIALYPTDGPVSSLVGSARTAVTAAFEEGGGRYRFFESAMNADAHAKSEWLEQLRFAVERGEFELYYQPKFHAASGEIAGVEALLRWHHATRGMVSPVIFIPLAEQFGLIGELGHWVIEQACRQMQAWRSAGIEMRVAVNVSAQQLRLPSFSDELAECLHRYGVNPALLTCELTESAAMEDIGVSLPILQRLQAAGVQVSIDDFGTGYSSLSYLRKLPIRQLKIDRSFVNDLCDSDDARAVVASIINLAHTLRLEVVAEGVETDGQRVILTELGCDKFQGFLFARPMTATELNLRISRNCGEPGRTDEDSTALLECP